MLINENNFGYCLFTKDKMINKFDINSNFSNKKIQKNNALLLRDIEFSKRIKTIPKYFYYFSPIISAEKTIIRDCNLENSNIINEFSIIYNNTSYVTIKYNYTNNLILKQILCDWKSFFKNKKRFYLFLFETYHHLLDAITILLHNSFINFYYCFNNIYINHNTQLPYIMDFSYSLDITNIKKSLSIIKNIAKERIYIYPFEIYIINYIFNQPEKNLNILFTEKNITFIANDFINNHKFYNKFNITDYDNICISLLKNYATYSYKGLLIYLFRQNIFWDNYLLSMIMLETFETMFTEDIFLQDNNNTCIITDFIDVLKQNIHPNFMMRNSIDNTKKKTTKILFNNNIDAYNHLLKHVF